jgi:hypothetical protein
MRLRLLAEFQTRVFNPSTVPSPTG